MTTDSETVIAMDEHRAPVQLFSKDGKWGYYFEEYPDEGFVGPFDSEEEARAHALVDGGECGDGEPRDE